jgi:hypothetical protein
MAAFFSDERCARRSGHDDRSAKSIVYSVGNPDRLMLEAAAQ